MTIKRLTDLSPATIDAAAEVYAASFNVRTFYVFKTMYGDMPEEKVDAISLIKFRQTVYRAISDHEMYAAYPPGEDRIGAVMTLKLPVDDGLLGLPAETPTPYDDEVKATMPDFAVERDDLVSVYLYSLNQIHANMKKLKTRSWGEDDKHNYHISYLGTAPWAQKKGLGSELIRMSMERARKEGREVSLSTHTEENADFYQRLGFKITGYDEWTVESTPFRWWCMTTDMKGASK